MLGVQTDLHQGGAMSLVPRVCGFVQCTVVKRAVTRAQAGTGLGLVCVHRCTCMPCSGWAVLVCLPCPSADSSVVSVASLHLIYTRFWALCACLAYKPPCMPWDAFHAFACLGTPLHALDNWLSSLKCICAVLLSLQMLSLPVHCTVLLAVCDCERC